MWSQSDQYNKVQRPYDELRKTTIAIVERVNVREILLPFVKEAAVLDLACGSGFYTRSFLDWGAKFVVGVDISAAMVQEARAMSMAKSSNISFVEADCSKPNSFPGEPFDIAFGGWFLNYASTHAELVDFYRNIYVNLKPGGLYVGVTPPPNEDPATHYERECIVRPLPAGSGKLWTVVTGTVEDGVIIHAHSDTPAGDLDFTTYHLRKSVWESAAKEAGFSSDIQWSKTHVPDDFMKDPLKYGEPVNGGAGPEELATYTHLPHYGLLVLRK